MAHKGRIMTVLFCGFLAGLLVWHIALPDRARSETENRTLAQRPSLSRETLLNLFADKEWNKFDRSVDVHISTLRKKLADATGTNTHIRTVRSMGYVFIRQDDEA